MTREVIDAHQHLWDPTRARYDWLKPDSPLSRPFVQADIEPTFDSIGVAGAVLVQAADNREDTDLMFEAAANSPSVLGVVAWVPLDAPEQVSLQLDELVQRPHFAGVRNLFHAKEDDSWVLRTDVGAGIAEVVRRGVSLDYVTSSSDALNELLVILDRHPEARIVIDHLGKPPLAGTDAELRRWRELLAAAAEYPGVSAKISGLYFPDAWSRDDVIDRLDRVVGDAIDTMGAEHLMYGGDWPISEDFGGYQRQWDLLSRSIAFAGPDVQSDLFAGTARRVYRLGAGPGTTSPKETLS